MNTYSYIVSLRARHPSDDIGFLSNILEMKPSVAWVAGDARMTHDGGPIGGVREDSYWASRLTDQKTSSQAILLEEVIDNCVNKLLAHKDELLKFVQSGGRFELFVSLFGSQNYGLILSSDLLARLGAASVELQLDVYSEEGEQ